MNEKEKRNATIAFQLGHIAAIYAVQNDIPISELAKSIFDCEKKTVQIRDVIIKLEGAEKNDYHGLELL